ncbi:MAG: hypothetical protein LBH49_00380 [Puniceicoccales bacterium]|jgi:hypothetical protein|nr:hypothetical protein [Puniceicoccales bacterium]
MSEINRICQNIRNLKNTAAVGHGEMCGKIKIDTNEVTVSVKQNSKVAAFFNKKFNTTFGIKYSFVAIDGRKSKSLTKKQAMEMSSQVVTQGKVIGLIDKYENTSDHKSKSEIMDQLSAEYEALSKIEPKSKLQNDTINKIVDFIKPIAYEMTTVGFAAQYATKPEVFKALIKPGEYPSIDRLVSKGIGEEEKPIEIGEYMDANSMYDAYDKRSVTYEGKEITAYYCYKKELLDPDSKALPKLVLDTSCELESIDHQSGKLIRGRKTDKNKEGMLAKDVLSGFVEIYKRAEDSTEKSIELAKIANSIDHSLQQHVVYGKPANVSATVAQYVTRPVEYKKNGIKHIAEQMRNLCKEVGTERGFTNDENATIKKVAEIIGQDAVDKIIDEEISKKKEVPL